MNGSVEESDDGFVDSRLERYRNFELHVCGNAQIGVVDPAGPDQDSRLSPTGDLIPESVDIVSPASTGNELDAFYERFEFFGHVVVDSAENVLVENWIEWLYIFAGFREQCFWVDGCGVVVRSPP